MEYDSKNNLFMKCDMKTRSLLEGDITKNAFIYFVKDSYVISDIDNTICFTYRKWANECCKRLAWFKEKVEKAIGAEYIIDDEKRMEYHKIYDENEHFYDDIEITCVGSALQILGIRRLMIMSHFDKNSKNMTSKLNLVNRLYGSNVPCFLVPLEEPKSNYINKSDVRFFHYIEE